MKILTKEEQAAHYREVVRGGAVGTILGCIGGLAGVVAGSRRFHTVRTLTLPMKAFLVTSSSTFVGIIAADHSSRAFEAARNKNLRYLEEREAKIHKNEFANMTTKDRVFEFLHKEKYKIIGVTWIASIVGSFILVGRNPYLTGQQKIVQARVYAQGLTVALMCTTAAFEIHSQRQGRGIMDPAKQEHHERYEGEDMWKDMVDAEAAKLKSKHRDLYGRKSGKKEDEKKDEKSDEKKDEKSDEKKDEKSDEKK
ncbi:mitochondrial hypoxia responsive domain protein, partial [Talaromyces proteolyticus]